MSDSPQLVAEWKELVRVVGDSILCPWLRKVYPASGGYARNLPMPEKRWFLNVALDKWIRVPTNRTLALYLQASASRDFPPGYRPIQERSRIVPGPGAPLDPPTILGQAVRAWRAQGSP